MRRTPLTQQEVDRLPMDTIITVGGIKVHTAWFGGIFQGPTQWDTFWRARYGYAKDRSGPEITDDFINFDGEHVYRIGWESGNDLETLYIAANGNSVTVPAISNMLVNDGWKFFSSTPGLLYILRNSYPVPMSVTDFVVNPYITNYTDWADSENPIMQHYPFCAMTNTRKPNGQYALYTQDETSELATALSFLNGSGTIVLAIDGTGSFNGGAEAITYMTAVLNAYMNQWSAPPNTRLIVTKFSDDFMHEQDMYDGIVVGDYPSITPDSIAAAVYRVGHFQTGNGGDTNETQLMGIYEGMKLVKNQPGPKAVIVYTDAAAVCPMPINTLAPPLRQRHRDDGLAVDSREQKGQGSSQQTSLRRGGKAYY